MSSETYAHVEPPVNRSAPTDSRSEFIEAMRRLADWLEAETLIPLDTASCRVQLSVVRGDEDERLQGVAAVALAMGAPRYRDDRGHTATQPFDDRGNVTFTVHAATDVGRAIVRAENSYYGAVTP
jgi:hypothetical protein